MMLLNKLQNKIEKIISEKLKFYSIDESIIIELSNNIITTIVSIDKLDEILQAVCIVENIELDLFLSNKRDRYLSEARAAYCILAKEKTDYSLTRIGKKINRDYTTVMHHLQNSSNHHSVKEIVKKIR